MIETKYGIFVDPNKLRSDMFLFIRDLELKNISCDIIRAYIGAFDFVLSQWGEDYKIKEKGVKDGKQENVHKKDC